MKIVSKQIVLDKGETAILTTIRAVGYLDLEDKRIKEWPKGIKIAFEQTNGWNYAAAWMDNEKAVFARVRMYGLSVTYFATERLSGHPATRIFK